MRTKIFYGWIITFCCFLSASSYGFFFSLGVFFKPLQSEFGWSSGLISTIHSLHIAVVTFAMPVIGRMADRYGSRIMFLISAILMGIGFSLCGTVRELWQFYAFYLFASLGVGATTALPTSIVQKWFVKKKGLALGIVVSGIGAGPLIAAPLANYLISHYQWRTSYFIIGGLLWIVLTLVALAMVDKPADMGLRPLGEEELDNEESGQLQEGRAIADSNVRHERREWITQEAVKTKTFVIMGFIWTLCALPVHLVMINIVPFAINMGIPKGAAAAGLGFIGGMSILGRLLGGAFSDFFGLKRSLMVAAFFSTATLLWLPFIGTSSMFFAFVVVYGFFYGARVPQIPGLIGNYFGTKNLTEIMGIFWAMAGIGAIIGSLTGGFVFDITGSYFIPFLVAAVCFGLAGALTFFLETPQLRSNYVTVKAEVDLG
ncbi:MAG: MFS transporter [Thermodesulfobacteriota bacterium]|nr:MFS transporter [Thermodesulfobacteriota bacterium]